jgi:nucleoside-diphosphate-sugar epimerase
MFRFAAHAAAALPLSNPTEILSTDVEGTRVVLNAARVQGVSRVIFTSATSVYGIPDHHPLREGDELRGVGPSGMAKIEAERSCLASRAQGMCVSVLRPKSLVGPERLGVFELLYDFAFQGRNFPVLGSGENLYQLLDVEDVCQAIYLNYEGHGRPGPQAPAHEETAECCRRAVHRESRIRAHHRRAWRDVPPGANRSHNQ